MGVKTADNRRTLINKVHGKEDEVITITQPYTDGSKSIARRFPDGHVEYEVIEADGTILKGMDLPRGFWWSDAPDEDGNPRPRPDKNTK